MGSVNALKKKKFLQSTGKITCNLLKQRLWKTPGTWNSDIFGMNQKELKTQVIILVSLILNSFCTDFISDYQYDLLLESVHRNFLRLSLFGRSGNLYEGASNLNFELLSLKNWIIIWIIKFYNFFKVIADLAQNCIQLPILDQYSEYIFLGFKMISNRTVYNNEIWDFSLGVIINESINPNFTNLIPMLMSATIFIDNLSWKSSELGWLHHFEIPSKCYCN